MIGAIGFVLGPGVVGSEGSRGNVAAPQAIVAAFAGTLVERLVEECVGELLLFADDGGHIVGETE